MKYIIKEDRLYNIFSKWMESTFGELSIDERDEISYKTSNGKNEYFGYITYVRSEGKFIFYFYYSKNIVRLMESMFGDQWDKLLLKYLQEKFPAYHVEDVQI